MAAVQTGVDMQLAYKAQSALGTAASGSGGQSLRRVQSTLELTKDTYQSAEIRPDYQVADFRHGFKKAGGTISGELSAGSYADFTAAFLRQAYTAVTAITGVSLTIAGSGPTYTVTRSAGDFLTGGIKIGHVVRLSVGSLNAANISKNLLVTGVTSTVLTVLPVNGVALVAEGPIATCTVTVTGKQSFCPTSSQTAKYFTIEHYYPNMSAVNSETFTDCVICDMALNLPPTGMATVDFNIMGLGMTTGTSQVLTSPTAVTTSGITAAVNGVLRASSGALANVTGIKINGTNNCSVAGPVVGSNVGVDVVKGRHVVTGEITAFFDSVTLRDAFLNETELGLYAVLTADSTAASSFIAISIDRLKLGGATRSDGEGIKTVTLPFQALYNTSGGSGISTEATTLRMQDSAA